jgi:hypothetical protein
MAQELESIAAAAHQVFGMGVSEHDPQLVAGEGFTMSELPPHDGDVLGHLPELSDRSHGRRLRSAALRRRRFALGIRLFARAGLDGDRRRGRFALDWDDGRHVREDAHNGSEVHMKALSVVVAVPIAHGSGRGRPAGWATVALPIGSRATVGARVIEPVLSPRSPCTGGRNGARRVPRCLSCDRGVKPRKRVGPPNVIVARARASRLRWCCPA